MEMEWNTTWDFGEKMMELIKEVSCRNGRKRWGLNEGRRRGEISRRNKWWYHRSCVQVSSEKKKKKCGWWGLLVYIDIWGPFGSSQSLKGFFGNFFSGWNFNLLLVVSMDNIIFPADKIILPHILLYLLLRK